MKILLSMLCLLGVSASVGNANDPCNSLNTEMKCKGTSGFHCTWDPNNNNCYFDTLAD